MILLNFSHPLSNPQRTQIESLSHQEITEVISIKTHFQNGEDFQAQLPSLMKQIPLTSEEYQSKPILVIPPALNFLAVLVLSDLHGRMGYFPSIVRLRPVEESLPPQYEVAEIINLQEVRNEARLWRVKGEEDG